MGWRGRALLRVAAVLATLLALSPVLTARPLAYQRQISPDSFDYAEGALHLVSGNGYVSTYPRGEPLPPRYPPGFSIALTPFVAVGPFPEAIQVAVKLYAGLYVLAAIGAAWLLGGPLAAVIMATLVGFSPWPRDQARLIMSDAFAAALTIILVALLERLSSVRTVTAGLLAGALVVVRISSLVTLAAVVATVSGAHRRRALIFAAPPILALALYQWLTFGNPLTTGYNYRLPEIKNFDLAYPFVIPEKADPPPALTRLVDRRALESVCGCRLDTTRPFMPNIAFYPAVLLGLFPTFVPPFATLPGMLYAWRQRRRAAARFGLLLTIGSVIFYSFYFFQAARFLAAPTTILGIFSAVQIARWIERRGWQTEQPAPQPATA